MSNSFLKSFGIKRAVSALLVGATIGVALFLVPVMMTRGVFDPIPYRVIRDSVNWVRDGDDIVLALSFIKDGCLLQDTIARGRFIGVVDPAGIPILNVNGEIKDTLKGEQSVVLRIGPLLKDYEIVTVHTRHLCQNWMGDDIFIDRVLARMVLIK